MQQEKKSENSVDKNNDNDYMMNHNNQHNDDRDKGKDWSIIGWLHSFFFIRINFIRIMSLKIGEI